MQRFSEFMKTVRASHSPINSRNPELPSGGLWAVTFSRGALTLLGRTLVPKENAISMVSTM